MIGILNSTHKLHIDHLLHKHPLSEKNTLKETWTF
jgi:hypothetical protein